ncbi:MAG: hypothetical protein ACR2MX_14770 [Cyclobacteriaceae bacterium]
MIELKSTLICRELRLKIETGKLSLIDNDEDKTADVDARSINFYLGPKDNLASVYNALMLEYKEKSGFGYYFTKYITRAYHLVGVLIFALVFVVLLGLVEIYGNALYDIVGNAFEFTGGVKLFILVGSGVLLAIAIILVPALFQGDVSAGRKWLKEKTTSDGLMQRRILRTLKRISSINKNIRSLNVWNPNLFNNKRLFIVDSLIRKAVRSKFDIVLYIRVDEKARTKNYISSLFGSQLQWEEHITENLEGDPKDYFPLKYMDEWEKDVLSLLLFCSTLNLPSFSPEIIQDPHAIPFTISAPLAEIIYDKFKSKLHSTLGESSNITIDSLVSRFINDYNYFEQAFEANIDNWRLKDPVIFKELKNHIESDLSFIYAYIQSDTVNLVRILNDPISSILILNANKNNSIYSINRIKAIEKFISLSARDELFSTLRYYWPLATAQNSASPATSNEDILRLIDVKILWQLVDNFFYAGMYDEVNTALKFLEPINSVYADYMRIRIEESRGKYHEAALDYIHLFDKMKTFKVKEILELKIKMGFSWTVVSGRISEDGLREKGKAMLAEMEQAIDEMITDEIDTKILCDLKNYQANYAEWDNDLDSAITHYDSALSIPGIGTRKYSSILVNHGIAHRKKAETEKDRKKQREMFRLSLKHGEMGVEVKQKIGNDDQLPIAIHNYCETLIRLAQIEEDREKKAQLYETAKSKSTLAIEVQNRINSTKKKDQLLVENLVSNYYLMKNDTVTKEVLMKSLFELSEYLKSNGLETFDRNESLKILSLIKPENENIESTKEAIQFIEKMKFQLK